MSTEPPTIQRGQRVQLREKFGWGSIFEIIGWLILLPGLLVLFVIFVMTFSSEAGIGKEISAGTGVGAAAIFAVPSIVIGWLFCYMGKRINTKWICSVCGNKLSYRTARLCSTCKSELD